MVLDKDPTNSLKLFWWMMGLIATLMSAGVVAGVATYAEVHSLSTTMSIVQGQMVRDLDRQDARIRAIETKLDNFIASQRGN